ncbi:NepR family anti-sigma factor [Ahrensia sp. R2A130]|uniref:NepR family anti-sigma factor n=1 Tax=Ahrensia sp. R2A130 TaxID=744979 RepID=UPI0001E0ACF9|nr:NepR family anti-sigma factor [Ahrensia sp. R2A130]EFL87756.1 ECF subfamily RNA polymerase sigma-24 factor [Ahrensia sp. R2A130]
MNSNDDANEPKPVLEAKVQAELGKKLQQVYSDVISEPVPDRFLDLLQELENSSSTKR